MKKSIQHPIPRRTLAAFAAPNFALAIMHMPVLYVIPTLYAMHTEVSLASIATILLIGRLFDALTDPLIGFFSDRTKSRLGKRKPWMISGTPTAMLAIIFLFSPPSTAGELYFLVWSILLFASWTLIDIPYLAWSSELSHDYDERSRIMTWREIFGNCGSILFMAAPLFLLPWTGTTEIGLEVMTIAAWMAATTLPVLLYFAVKHAPEGKEVSIRPVELKDFWMSLRTNKPLYRCVAGTLMGAIGSGMWGATFLIFLSAYMGIADKFIFILLAAWITRLFVAPLCLKLIYRYGKHKVWAVGMFCSALIIPTILLIPIGTITFPFMLLYAVILGGTETALIVAPRTIFGDIIDYDTLKTGSNKASSFFALYGLLVKVAAGLGAAIGFYLLSAFGFNAKGVNDQSQLTGLVLAFAIVPPMFYAFCGLIVWNFPLNARRQGIIKRRLESRADRMTAANNLDAFCEIL